MNHLTCCSSFSNVDAKMSIGPRTAYSVFLMFGLSVSMVRSLLAMLIFAYRVRLRMEIVERVLCQSTY